MGQEITKVFKVMTQVVGNHSGKWEIQINLWPLGFWTLVQGKVQNVGSDGVLICISDQLMMAYGGPKHQLKS